MYYCKLDICIFSSDPSIEEQVRQSVPLEHFEHNITCSSTFSPVLAQKTDVIIFDLPLCDDLAALRKHGKKNAVFVLCADQATLSSLEGDSYQVIDEVWGKPFTPALLAFYFHKLQKELKIRKDFRLTESYLETAINSIPDLVWFKDIRGAHLKVNNGFCRAVGKSKQEIEGRGHYFIWDLKKEEYEKGEYVCLETDDMVMEAKRTCLFDEKVKSKYGLRQFKTYKSPIFDENHVLIGTVGIAHDVTELGNMDAELGVILASIPFAILVRDEQNKIVKVNEKFESYFHELAKDIIGKDYLTWRLSALNNVTNSNPAGDTEVTLCFNNEKRIVEVHEERILDVFQNAAGYICIFRDVTNERSFKQELLRNANTDSLTDLYNRRFFYEYMEAHRSAKQISLLYIDIDNFKKVNDSYGHQVGDEVLVLVSRLLGKIFPNDLIARVGGDEFLVAILGECSVQELEHKTKCLLSTIHESFQASKELSILSISVGIALTQNQAKKIDDLIKESDTALYEAKHRGKAQYCTYSAPAQGA